MKNRRLEIRLTEDELYEIDNKAQKLRMSRSKFLLQSALHQKIITLDNTAIKQLISELRKYRYQYKSYCNTLQYGKVAMCTY
ncbi:MAG: hypothetical protein V8T43_01990 [Eubacteriales bacterium]